MAGGKRSASRLAALALGCAIGVVLGAGFKGVPRPPRADLSARARRRRRSSVVRARWMEIGLGCLILLVVLAIVGGLVGDRTLMFDNASAQTDAERSARSERQALADLPEGARDAYRATMSALQDHRCSDLLIYVEPNDGERFCERIFQRPSVGRVVAVHQLSPEDVWHLTVDPYTGVDAFTRISKVGGRWRLEPVADLWPRPDSVPELPEHREGMCFYMADPGPPTTLVPPCSR